MVVSQISEPSQCKSLFLLGGDRSPTGRHQHSYILKHHENRRLAGGYAGPFGRLFLDFRLISA